MQQRCRCLSIILRPTEAPGRKSGCPDEAPSRSVRCGCSGGSLYVCRAPPRSALRGVCRGGRALPGDEIVSNPMWQSTRAITIAAPPEQVWPWIVQMGFPSHRAGWYTPHRLDRLSRDQHRSADRIVPELQHLDVGDRVPDSDDWSAFFTVEAIEPPHALVLHSTRHVIKPIKTIDFSWAFVILELSPGTSRLFIRARANYTPRRALPFVESDRPCRFLQRRRDAARNQTACRRRLSSPVPTRRSACSRTRSPRRHNQDRRYCRDEERETCGAASARSPRPRHSSCSRRSTVAGISAGERPTPRLPARCPATTSSRSRRSTRRARSPSTLHRRRSGRGSSRSATGGPASTATTFRQRRASERGADPPGAPGSTDRRLGTDGGERQRDDRVQDRGFEPNRFLLWKKPHSTWAWKLEPITGGRTRLITRLKDRYAWRANPAIALLSLILFEFGDFPMMRKLLLEVRARSERDAADAAAEPQPLSSG